MKPTLHIRYLRFSEADMRAWKGAYSLVKDCPKPLKAILREKARRRPGRRFFGEAKVAAASLPYQEGWYGSFKWLTSPRWCSEETPMAGYQQQFREALLRHFPELCQFQQVVADSMDLIGDRKPVGPDLWLVTRSSHRFIEVKLPRDKIARHQLAGLAMIALHLPAKRAKSVEVVHLCDSVNPDSSEQLQDEFDKVCRSIGRWPGDSRARREAPVQKRGVLRARATPPSVIAMSRAKTNTQLGPSVR